MYGPEKQFKAIDESLIASEPFYPSISTLTEFCSHVQGVAFAYGLSSQVWLKWKEACDRRALESEQHTLAVQLYCLKLLTLGMKRWKMYKPTKNRPE